MSPTRVSCVLLADRHHDFTEGVRGLLETAFGTVVVVADEASLLDGAGARDASRPLPQHREIARTSTPSRTRSGPATRPAP